MNGLLELGHLPADRHEFTVAGRRQARRDDVRIHRRELREGEYSIFQGLPVTTPARTAADLLANREDPEAVAQVIVDALRKKREWPQRVAAELAPRAAGLGLRRGDGYAALARLLALGGDPAAERWLREARGEPVDSSRPDERDAPPGPLRQSESVPARAHRQAEGARRQE